MTIWRVHWQDYRGFRERFHDEHPVPRVEDFDNKDKADARKLELQRAGMIANVSEYVLKKRQERKGVRTFNKQRKTWTLT